jgi:hypothetical protein
MPFIPLVWDFVVSIELLSLAIISYHTSLPSFMMLSLACLCESVWSSIPRDVR